MKDNRSPVIVDICYSLEWFLLAFTGIVPFAYGYADDPAGFCLRTLMTIPVFIAVALVFRADRVPVLRIIVPILGIAACALLGSTTGQRVVLGLAGALAALCGIMLHTRCRKDPAVYNEMFFIIALPVVASLIAWKFSAADVTRWFNIISAVYLPLGIIIWFCCRESESMSIFRNRPDQPLKPVNRRMRNMILSVAVAVLIVAVLMPQFNGSSLIRDALMLLLALLITIMSSFSCNQEISSEPMQNVQQTIAPAEEGSSVISRIIAAVFVLALLIWGLIILIRVIRNFIIGLLKRGEKKIIPGNTKYDTIEKLDRPRNESKKRQSGKTNAAKVRRIYRKRITEILGKDNVLRASHTPSEIARLCKKKDEDVTELTKLYNKARYTNSCTDEDVRAAKKL